MANFQYQLNVTGDCNSQGVGIISILPQDGTPPYSIEWVNPSLPPIEVVTDTPSVRTGLYPGLYVISLSDSSEPTNNQFLVNATVSSGCCASISNVYHSTCGTNNGSVTATSSTYLSSVVFDLYTSGGTQLNSFNSNTGEAVFVGLSAGTYYIVVTDIGGCSAKTSDFIILDSSPLDFGFYTVPNSACSTILTPIGKIYVTGQTGTSPYTYLWSNNATGSTVTGLTNGFYSCTVTDANGCTATKNTEIVDVLPLGLIYFSADTPTCFNADGQLKVFISGGTGPYYYSASTGNVDISYAQNFTISNIPQGTYQFVITDAGLCQISVGTNLQTPQSIGSVDINATNSTCSATNGGISISVGQGLPPFTYTLVYPDSSNDSATINLPNYAFNNLSAGTYTVFVEDQSSCVFSQVVNIFTSNLFTLNTSVTGSTCGINNGAIYVQKTTGGTEPYTYSIDDVNVLPNTSLTAFTFTNVSQGSHLVSITDAGGCVQSTTVYVGGTPQVDFTLYPVGCGNGSEGSITAFISSGTPPFTFDWSDNVLGNPQSITANNLTGGTYSLTIIDFNGCSLERTTTISCSPVTSGYVSYPVGTEELLVTVESELGMLEMLNDGFQDLTGGNPNCILNSTSFVALVAVTPVGLYLQQVFYTGTTLIDVPASNLWYTAIESLLITVPGVESVNIDPLTNQITITKSSTNPYLNGQVINISIEIEYDIDC
jgi:hypothetical protein